MEGKAMAEPQPLSDLLRERAAALAITGMQLAVFERIAEGHFVGINALPEWFLKIAQSDADADHASCLTDHFPALEGFLPVAEEYWVSSSTEPLQSKFWAQVDDDKVEYHLLAYATRASDRHFLVIERAEATFIAQRQLQLYAHEMGIQHEKIERLNREVERADRAKSEFLATMSHEIRTPLNAILGMADLLAETSLSAEQRQYVTVFQRAGANLLGLINDILDLSKVEAGQMELESVDFDLAEVIGRTLELTRAKASMKGLEVGFELKQGVPRMLVGDPLRLRQILLNLLGNAMKFTETGRLDVIVVRDPDGAAAGDLRFGVRDTGIGIPADKLDSIFENFSQADSSTTRKYGGTGLGLAISRRLVELMGGRIWVESTVGVGSTFLFTAKFGVSDRVPSAPEAPLAQAPRTLGLPAAHILLADDSDDNRFLIREYLKASPCQLEMAENGEIALARMKAGHFDLVLMDAHMPVMDGYTATRAMRAWEAAQGAPPVPILALTADAFREAVEQSAAAGFNAHLTKPISKATLVEAIERYARPCDRPHMATPAPPPVPPPAADTPLSAFEERYLKNVVKSLNEVRIAEAGADYGTIQRVGHNLHGTGGSFGFPRITEYGKAMEQAAKDQAMGPVRAALAQLEEYVGQVLR
jgi:signal transduction histidine kinase/FixJ family two-component response regulator